MAYTLYVTYTRELGEHARKLCEIAKGAGWKVTDGPRELLWEPEQRFKKALESDVFVVLSAYAYDAEPGRAEQESQWDEIRAKGKPAFALLVDPGTSWPVAWVEGYRQQNRKSALENFQEKLKRGPFRFFRESIDSIAAPVAEQLQRLDTELAAASQTKLFVVWDFSTAGLPLLLDALKRWPPKGYTINVPGIGAAAGEIFRDIVLPGIENSDRVLVATDKPNANVAFEAGLALGYGKPIALIHFGSATPSWLRQSLFKGFVVNSIRTLDDIRASIINDDCWFAPKTPPTPTPDHGSTLFLAPRSFVGAALHEIQAQKVGHWKQPPESVNFNDISLALGDIAHTVWAISVYSDGADTRDGAENAANALIAGWFYARAHAANLNERLSILRQEEARIVLDVQVPEAPFQNIDTFSKLIIDVPDRRLPLPVIVDKRDFGPSDLKYRMVKIPSQGDKSLWVGAHPVTNRQYLEFCAASGYAPPTNLDRSDSASRLPVVEVSLKDAQEFCKWAGFDLPAPALWRYFALSGSSGKYWWGDDESAADLAAWFVSNSENRRHDVCTRSPNVWGLYDVFGNIWELACYEDTEQDPYGGTMRVPKALGLGGAFNTTASDLLVSSKRDFTDKDVSTGFRCIRWEA